MHHDASRHIVHRSRLTLLKHRIHCPNHSDFAGIFPSVFTIPFCAQGHGFLGPPGGQGRTKQALRRSSRGPMEVAKGDGQDAETVYETWINQVELT